MERSGNPAPAQERGNSQAAPETRCRAHWPSRAIRTFLQSVPNVTQRGFEMKKKIDISAVPELRTSVGMHGSLKQKEVGGPVCLGIAIAILYAL